MSLMHTSHTPSPALSHRDIKTIVGGIILAMLLGALDQTIVATAMPTIGRELGDEDQVSWVASIYLLTATAVTPLYGKLSDIHGRRIVLLAAIIIFTLGSIVCALAPTMFILIVARAAQGMGGGGLISLAQTIIADIIAPKERGRYQIYIASVFMMASVLGPVLGGFFTEHLHWSLIFWINLPLGFAAYLMTSAALKKLPRHDRPHHLDILGAVLMVAHWDHFGRCADPPAEHLICNGAVDNASGLAVITEAARILASGKPMDRDVYVLATTGEELGLLGAEAFAENPPVPLDSIMAVFNVDSTGIVGAGQPVSVIGAGMTDLDDGIAAVLKALHRRPVPGNGQTSPANAFVRRQDGWAFISHDVPAVMVSSAYSDPKALERFMDERYHRPTDVAARVEYGGMVEDVTLQVELVRFFADTRRFPGPPVPRHDLTAR